MSSYVDVLCLSQRRWADAPPRARAMLRRAARARRVYYVEPPQTGEAEPRLALGRTDDGVVTVTPRLSALLERPQAETAQRRLLDELVEGHRLDPVVLWYLTPLALAFTHHLPAHAVVYDRLAADEDAAVAPVLHVQRAAVLMQLADVVLVSAPRARPDDERAWEQAWSAAWAQVERSTGARGRPAAAG